MVENQGWASRAKSNKRTHLFSLFGGAEEAD